MDVLVSVIVPNFNHAAFLEQRITSILDQSFNDYELILLDDCSTDNSVEILNRYVTHPKVSAIIVNEVNSGSPFLQWRKGVEFAKGKFVWIAESDDFADDDFLERMTEEIIKTGSVMAVCGSRIIVDETCTEVKPLISETMVLNSEKAIQEYLFMDCSFVNVSAVIFEKSALEIALSRLPPFLKLTGDWFCYVLVASQGTVAVLKDVLNNFRMHRNTVRISTLKFGYWLSEGAFIQKYICKHNNIESYQRDDLKEVLYKRYCKYLPRLNKEFVFPVLNRISFLIGGSNYIKAFFRATHAYLFKMLL